MTIKFDVEKFKKYAMQLALEAMKGSAFEIRDEIRQSMVDSPEWAEKTYYRKGRKHHPSQPGNPASRRETTNATMPASVNRARP